MSLFSNRKPLERIEIANQHLYDRDAVQENLRRSSLSSSDDREEVPTNWSSSSKMTNNLKSRSRRSFWSILLIFSSLFFLSAIIFAVYTLYRGGNVISPTNVEVAIDGPKTIKAGEVLNLQILVTNKNASPLNSADLIVEFFNGARSPQDITKGLTRDRISLGQIDSGSSVNQTVKAVVFGDKDSEQEIKVSIEYRIADSNAIFDKVSLFRYQISSSPVTLNLTLPTEVNSGQPVTLDLELVASPEAPLRGLVVNAVYPPGFTFISSSPLPLVDTNVWRIGDLPAGGRMNLKVFGRLEGQDDDPKSFRFSAGLEDAGGRGDIAVNYGEIFKVMTIKRPFVALRASINGGGVLVGESVANSGEPIRVDISWVNNLPTEVTSGELIVALGGAALDQRSVIVTGNGFYQSATNQIVWRQNSQPSLTRLSPGGEGQVSFNLNSLSLFGNRQSAILRPTIELSITFRGIRITADTASEKVETSIKKQIKINSAFQLASRAVYSDGPFANYGPLPPKVGQETSYTIMWSVINSSNDVNQAVVRATLPSYVRWLGVFNPNTEKISFDSATGEILWNLGNVDAGRGLSTAAREVSFQVALLPSLSQIGEIPILLTNPTLSGVDSFTHQTINDNKKSIDTQISSDSHYQLSQAMVIQ